MGTHSTVSVVVGGKYVVRQYGHWDGHTSGVGEGVRQFCAANLSTIAARTSFAIKASKVVSLADIPEETDDDGFASHGIYEPEHPEWVLDHIADSGKEPLLFHNGDEEYNYTVDLDRELLILQTDIGNLEWSLDALPAKLPDVTETSRQAAALCAILVIRKQEVTT